MPELRLRLAAREQRERDEQARAAENALAEACGKANASAKKLQTILAEGDRAARELIAKRAEVDAAAQTAGARMDDASPRPVEKRRPHLLWGAGTGRTPKGWLDEVDFLAGLEVLPKLLEEGPRQPRHDGGVEAGRKQREREEQDRKLLGWVRHHPGQADLVLARDDLSTALRGEVEEIRAEVIRSAASARSTAEAERRRERRERAEEEETSAA